MAQNVVGVMKNMAEKGKTVLTTIHQPSSDVYAMFDRVLFIAEGRVAFLGDADDAMTFFTRYVKLNFNFNIRQVKTAANKREALKLYLEAHTVK